MPVFTKANAAEMQSRAQAAIRAKKAAPQPQPQSPQYDPQPASDPYRTKRIEVTRSHIERLDRQLQTCTTPKDLKAIADAIYRLQETERMLSGWFKPGTLKPPGRTEHNSNSLSFPQPIGPAED